MPGHPVDVVVDETVRAAVRVAPALGESLRLLSCGDRLPASLRPRRRGVVRRRPGRGGGRRRVRSAVTAPRSRGPARRWRPADGASSRARRARSTPISRRRCRRSQADLLPLTCRRCASSQPSPCRPCCSGRRCCLPTTRGAVRTVRRAPAGHPRRRVADHVGRQARPEDGTARAPTRWLTSTARPVRRRPGTDHRRRRRGRGPTDDEAQG